jgi:glycosyltransferase involved in cell wall biosynthesis
MSIIISAITPASRGVSTLATLINDFKNQTFPHDAFEHIIVYDGIPPTDVVTFMEKNANPWTRFVHIEKDRGNMKDAPGTRPRNHGVSIARGEYVCFCDDDDRYKSTYLETLMSHTGGNAITILQMSCQHSRMYKDGDPNYITLIPEVGQHHFPLICHVGTPCFVVKREWALECPWQHEKEHDFRFIKRIVEKYRPEVSIIGGMQVDVDGLVLSSMGKMPGMKDWVSFPPFYRS